MIFFEQNLSSYILPVIYMICVLILVMPSFLEANSNTKVFLKNLSIWAIIVLLITIFIQVLDFFGYSKFY